jgi:hypothetical protein
MIKKLFMKKEKFQPISTIIDDDDEEEEETSIANSTTHSKSPLILRSPAPDSSPC